MFVLEKGGETGEPLPFAREVQIFAATITTDNGTDRYIHKDRQTDGLNSTFEL